MTTSHLFPVVTILGMGLARSAWAADAPGVDEPLRSGEKSPAEAAVVVGVENYAWVEDVPYASRDAQAFYQFLVYTRGVPPDRIKLLDAGANRELLLEALDWLGENTGPDGVAWFFFAGHGAANSSSGERMLMGDDVRSDPTSFDARSLTLREVEDAAGRGGGQVFLVLDTCYTGTGRSGEALLAGHRSLVPAYARPRSGTVLEWSAAAADEFAAPLHGVQHGAFSYMVLGALRGWADGEIDGQKDGVVTAEEAQAFVRRGLRTAQVDQQHPHLGATEPTAILLAKGVGEPEPLLDPKTLHLEPKPETGPRANLPLLAGAGGTAVVSGGMALLALKARATYRDDETPYEDLAALEKRANFFAAGSIGAGAVALGLGVTSFAISTRW